MSEPQDRPAEGDASTRSQVEALLEEARRILASDWRAAAALAQKALELEPSNLIAQSLRTMAHDRKREEEVARCFSAARQMRASGDLRGALAEAERCAAEYPLEPRLTQLREVLSKELEAAERAKAPPVEAPAPPTAAPAPPTPPTAPPPATEAEELAAMLARPKPPATPAEEPAAPAKPPGAPPPAPPAPPVPPRERPAGGLLAVLRNRPGLVWGITGAATALALIIIVTVLVSGIRKPSVRPVAVEVRTSPPGATIRVNNQVRGSSNLRLELAPGTYQLEAVLEGYQPAQLALEVQPGAMAPVELTLEPVAQTVQVITDLEAAQATLDEQPPEPMQEGQLTLSSLPAGQHTIKVTDRYGEASFGFEISPGGAPLVSAPPVARQVLALLVSQAGGRALVYSSQAAAKLALDGQPVGEVGPAGLELSNLAPGSHELSVGEGSDVKKFLLEVGPAPSLTAYLRSDRNVGTLVVVTNEDNVTVFLDGQRYPRPTRRGQLRITRAPKRYRVKVAKAGFEDEPEQTVEVRKGDEVKVAFKLRAAPRLASLSIRNATPGAEVLIDQVSLGTIGADGSFQSSNISPGEHTLELSKEKHRPVQLQRVFPVGHTVEVQGGEVTLRALYGTLRLAVSPPGARVTATRAGEAQPRAIPQNTVELEEGAWTLVARAPGYLERTERVQIAAGQTVSVELALTREARPAAVIASGMDGFEHPQNWTQEGEWFVRRGGNLVLHKPAPKGGTFSFNIMLAEGGGWFRGKRLEWVVDFRDERNHLLFQLDKDSFRRTVHVGGRKTETRRQHGLPVPEQITATVEIEVTPTSVIHRFRRGDDWVVVDSLSVPGQNFTLGQFGLMIQGRDEVRLSDFSFRPAK